MPSNLPSALSELLERVCKAVTSDDRINALLIGGSDIHVGLDQPSDLDFVLVVEEEHHADVMATTWI